MKHSHSFLRVFTVVFLGLVAFCIVTIAVLHSFVDWESIQQFSVEVILSLLLFLLLLILVSLGITSLFLLIRRLTTTAIDAQLLAIENGQYSKVKASVQEIWYRALFILNLTNFYEKSSAIAQKQEEWTSELQQIAAKPQYIGDETREEIIEMERHRIARELHDSVSQQLFAAMMMLSAMNEQKEQISPTLQKQLNLVEKVVNDSQAEMRALLLHLRPVSLENKTLRQGIESLLKELQTKVQMQIHWDLAEIRLLPGIEDHLFRITQELLSNALRHAKAKTLEVYLHESHEVVTLKVTDDGVGFDTNEQKAGSYGLSNIKERVQGMGGNLKIISFPNQGTVVEIKIPQTIKMEVEE